MKGFRTPRASRSFNATGKLAQVEFSMARIENTHRCLFFSRRICTYNKSQHTNAKTYPLHTQIPSNRSIKVLFFLYCSIMIDVRGLAIADKIDRVGEIDNLAATISHVHRLRRIHYFYDSAILQWCQLRTHTYSMVVYCQNGNDFFIYIFIKADTLKN